MCCLSDSVKKIPKWNFWKFLVNPEGKVVRFWRTDEPMESVRQEATALVREIILKKRVELWWSLSMDTRHIFVWRRCFLFPKERPDSELLQRVWFGGVSLQKRAGWKRSNYFKPQRQWKSFKASQIVCAFVRACVCLYGDHPVVNDDNYDEHSW